MRKQKNGLKRLFKPNTIFHFSIADALLSSLFEGSITFKEILHYGDFGIGTLNGLDGEVIILNGVPYTVRADGSAYVVDKTEHCPIIITTFFKKEFILPIDTLVSFSQLKEKLNSLFPTENIFYPIKITGEFKNITTRSIAKQNKPYKPVGNLVDEMVKFEYSNIEGVIIGYKSPPFVERVGVPGYHFHFIDKKRKVGGHLLDFELIKGKVEYALARDFHVKLETSVDFNKLDLNTPQKDLLYKIEKS